MPTTALPPRAASVRTAVVWTVGPLLLLVVEMIAQAQLRVPAGMGVWLVSAALLVACVGQCVAITKSRLIGKAGSFALRALGFLCTLVSCILLFLWVGWLGISSYYAFHPHSAALFGGR